MLKRLSLLSLFVILSCRGADDPAFDEEPIFGGRIDRSHHAVGKIGRMLEGDDIAFHCSGTLIGPRTVLTAAHCLYQNGRRLTASELGFDVADVPLAVQRSSVHPDYDPSRAEAWEDAALLRLAQPAHTAPIPVSIDPPLEGVEATVIGYGVTARGTGAGTRRRATITLDTVTGREILYRSDRAGACYGDSGGPLLQNDAIVGITSRGTATDCHGIDIAQRADVLTVWIGSTSRGDACIGWCEED